MNNSDDHYDLLESPQEFCPKCDSHDITNEQPVEDGYLPVNCLACGYCWHEKEE